MYAPPGGKLGILKVMVVSVAALTFTCFFSFVAEASNITYVAPVKLVPVSVTVDSTAGDGSDTYVKVGVDAKGKN